MFINLLHKQLMIKRVLLNGLMNLVFAGIFVYLNNDFLEKGFEESFITLAIIYGSLTTVGNAMFIYVFYGRRS